MACGMMDAAAAQSAAVTREVASMDTTLEQEMRASLVDGKLPCAEAFRIAKKGGVAPRDVGDKANELNIKISTCQLGCFP